MPRPTDSTANGERIAKLLARAGIASRREVERMIAEGRVALHDVVIDTPATLLASLQGVTVDGNPVAAPEPTRLFLYHKPVGLLVTERDPKGRPTIYDRLPRDLPRLVPVGRLDLNTEGLLLLTTDGGFKRQLELPATGVERAYRARVYGPITQARLEELIDGIEIDGIRYGSIDANMERRTGANGWIELTLTEGKNREVRRVLEFLGLDVSRLIRTRYGPFVLGDLPVNGLGEVRQADLVAFRQTLKDKGSTPAQPVHAAPLSGSPNVHSNGPAKVRRPHPTSHPGEGQGPVATSSGERTKPAGSSSPRPAPGLRRRGGKATQSAPRPNPHPSGASRLPPFPSGRGTGAASGGKGEGDATATGTLRPAKLQRKAGWAKPKPKAGPSRPRKPRA